MAFCFLPVGFQLPGCVKGVIGVSLAYELVGIFFVQGFPFTLPVRSVGMATGRFTDNRSTVIYTFIGNYAAPEKGVYDVLFRPGHETLHIGVFNTEYKSSSLLPGKQVIEKRCSHASHVKRPGRAGGKTYPDFLC